MFRCRSMLLGAALVGAAVGCAGAGEASEEPPDGAVRVGTLAPPVDATAPDEAAATRATDDPDDAPADDSDDAPGDGRGPATTVARGERSASTTVAGPGRPAATTTTDEPPVASERVEGSVAVVGDSLTVASQAGLDEWAEAYGFTVDIDARDGRRIQEGIDRLPRLAPDHDVVVIALGTNDATHADYRPEVANALIEAALARIDPDVPVLWVNVYRDEKSGAGEAAAVFNEAIEEAAERHENLVPLDWARYVADHNEIVAADRIHLTDEGNEHRAGWLAEAIAEHLAATD